MLFLSVDLKEILRSSFRHTIKVSNSWDPENCLYDRSDHLPGMLIKCLILACYFYIKEKN